MSKPVFAFSVPDVSSLARALRQQLEGLGRAPGHLELLNMLARGAGYANFQQFRREARSNPATAPIVETVASAGATARVDKAERQFDTQGRLAQWPSKASIAELCLWVLWSRLPADETLDERGISRLLDGWNAFGDHALLRRALYDFGLVERSIDGRAYRRIDRQPPAELAALNARLAAGQPMH